MGSKRISFKQSVNFDRQELEYLVLPYADYDPQDSVPESVPRIADPAEGEVYYFVDEEEERPALLVYVGRRGDTITTEDSDSNGNRATTAGGDRTVTLDIPESLKTAYDNRTYSGLETYLHIYTGENRGVYLVSGMDDVSVQLDESEPELVADSEIQFSLRDTAIFEWIDLAKPEEYLELSGYQPLISTQNQIPIEYISNMPLSGAELVNLAGNKLADGSQPWESNAVDISGNTRSINDIFEKVEIRDLNTSPNSILSSPDLSLTEAVEEIDEVALASSRNIYITDPAYDVGFYVQPGDMVNGEIDDIYPAMQIGGSRNTEAGLRAGVLFTSRFDSEGSYPFIRSDRGVNSTGSESEPDYTWYPYTSTGLYSTSENDIKVTVAGKNTLSIERNGSETSIGINQQDDGRVLRFLANADDLRMELDAGHNFGLDFVVDGSPVKFADVEVDPGDGKLVEMNVFPWIKMRNTRGLDNTVTLMRFDNTNGRPGMYFFNENDDQIGGVSGGAGRELNLISSKALNFAAEDEYRAKIDTFTEEAVRGEELSTSGFTLFKNQNTFVSYNGNDYCDYIEYQESIDSDKITPGDHIIVEESINGDIVRHFYDSKTSDRYVHDVDEANNRVFLKKYKNGSTTKIDANVVRVILNKVTTVGGNSRFVLTGLDAQLDETVELGGIRQIPFEDISLYSKTNRDIYVSPSGDNLFRFSRTIDDTESYSLPLLELTDENKIRLATLTADVEGDLVLSSHGNRSIIFARDAYMMLNKDNPQVTTFEIAGNTNENEHNARLALHGGNGNLELYSTSETGYLRLRNPVVLHNQVVDLTGAPTVPTPKRYPWPDPVIDFPYPIKPFPDILIPELDEAEKRYFDRRDRTRHEQFRDDLKYRTR